MISRVATYNASAMSVCSNSPKLWFDNHNGHTHTASHWCVFVHESKIMQSKEEHNKFAH